MNLRNLVLKSLLRTDMQAHTYLFYMDSDNAAKWVLAAKAVLLQTGRFPKTFQSEY